MEADSYWFEEAGEIPQEVFEALSRHIPQDCVVQTVESIDKEER